MPGVPPPTDRGAFLPVGGEGPAVEEVVSPAERAIRDDVRRWLGDNWDPTLSLRAWRDRLVDSGWAVPVWPERWLGRGLPPWADRVVAEEIRTAGAVGLPAGGGMALAAPTILAQGPDVLRERFLRPILTGEERWCQLFSEPGAGSDLAGLSTRAVLDGDEWVVNGQKVWTTSARHADFGMLLARTDWDVPKHRGLTYLLVPMHQEGIEVRPLRQMNHHASFNEVFVTDARIPKDHVVGAVGAGWSAALTTLAYERHFGSIVPPENPSAGGRAVEEARRETAEHSAAYKWYPQRAGRVDLAVEHARKAGRGDDPIVRLRVAELLARLQVGQWTADRARVARALGRSPGAEGSIGKLALSGVAREAALVHSLIGGAGGMLTGEDGTLAATVAEVLVSVPGQSIAGGTDEIQRNILGEKVLGLPREPAPDRDLPFRDVRRNG